MPRIKVLLADDDAQIQRDVSEILSDEGYEVSTVGSGEEALEVIDRVSHFDLIITDLMMPGMDGLELLKRIKEIEPSSTVIIFTAHATMERAIDAMRHGASDFVVKPYKIEEFIATINRYKETIELKRLKDLFMDIMRHDLLNPAGIARNMAEMVLDDEKDSNKREAVKTILRSSERIIEMIENASTLAKLESREKLEFKDRDLGEILRSVSAEMTHLADEKNMKIKINADGEFKALLNPLIHDVFSNLISNAIKYGPEDSEVAVGIEEDGINWKISVADNGSGIPEEDKEAIFDRFKRIEKGAVEGTGLGLAIVKRVVEAHEGRVWVEDNLDGGSIFFVQLKKA